jgi:hypothetical protein
MVWDTVQGRSPLPQGRCCWVATLDPEPKADQSKSQKKFRPSIAFTQSSVLITVITGRWEISGKFPGNIGQQLIFI